ncbi:MAG: hypothetical protein HZA91_20695 [Verrucomicrobia bacterium]|nr:hypothetical protein [Verrucomicrobiota bacterium]
MPRFTQESGSRAAAKLVPWCGTLLVGTRWGRRLLGRFDVHFRQHTSNILVIARK